LPILTYKIIAFHQNKKGSGKTQLRGMLHELEDQERAISSRGALSHSLS